MSKIWIGLWFGSDESEKLQIQRFKRIRVSNLPRAGEWLNIPKDYEFLVENVYHEFRKKEQRTILNCSILPLNSLKYYTKGNGWLKQIPK